ncbi:MAG: DUF6364 family protein [Pseudomonadota bacterium]
MQTQSKLTLRLDAGLIEHAKSYARGRGTSLSQLVADYFTALEQSNPETALPPLVASLKGIAKDSNLSEDNYKRHLLEKHLG